MGHNITQSHEETQEATNKHVYSEFWPAKDGFQRETTSQNSSGERHREFISSASSHLLFSISQYNHLFSWMLPVSSLVVNKEDRSHAQFLLHQVSKVHGAWFVGHEGREDLRL